MKTINIPISPIIRSKLDYLVDHYFNNSKLYSWKFNQFYYVLKDNEVSTTEEELAFKSLLYIYENFISYAFKYNVSECVKNLKYVLENNKRTRSRYRKIRIIESFAKGKVLKDRELINLLLEQFEKLFDYLIDRMLPEQSKNQMITPTGFRGIPWIKLERVVKMKNPIPEQIEKINNFKEDNENLSLGGH